MNNIATATGLGATRLDTVIGKDLNMISSFTSPSASESSHTLDNLTSRDDFSMKDADRLPKPVPRVKKHGHQSAHYPKRENLLVKTFSSNSLRTDRSESTNKLNRAQGVSHVLGADTESFDAQSSHISESSLPKEERQVSKTPQKAHPIPKPRLRSKSSHQSLSKSLPLEIKRISKSLSAYPETNMLMTPTQTTKEYTASSIDLSEFDPLKSYGAQDVSLKPSDVEILDNFTCESKAEEVLSSTVPNQHQTDHKEPDLSGTSQSDNVVFLAANKTTDKSGVSPKPKPVCPGPPAPYYSLETHAQKHCVEAMDITSETTSKFQIEVEDYFLIFPSPKDPFQAAMYESDCNTLDHSVSTSSGGSEHIVSPGTVASFEVQNSDINCKDLSSFNPTSSNTSVNSSASEASNSESEDNVFRDGCEGEGLTTSVKIVEGEATTRRNNYREGYLFKQGGQNANRGWRKRWVVFNGISLRYFVKSSACVSIHIIPLRCMVKVEQEIKDDDKENFRFLLHTTIKNRIFLFSAETRDDCVSWAHNLNAAITHFKNSGKQAVEIPDKEGFVKVNNSSVKRYLTLSKQTLLYYDSFEDFQLSFPKHEINLELASVKVKDDKKLKLRLSTNINYFDLTFDTYEDMQQWHSALKVAIATHLGDDRVLKQVYENPSNRLCADCSVERPQWAVINMGIVICENCAGVHRNFDTRVSKVRSLRMDTHIWTPGLVDMMIKIGNANANAFWEFNLPPGANVDHSVTTEKRHEFMKQKYLEKKFCDLLKTRVLTELVNSLSDDNVLEVMKCMFSGNVVSNSSAVTSSYDIAKAAGKSLTVEFLYQNGGDRRQAENVMNEHLEQSRLQGFLNKAGPKGWNYDKRWCVLDNGALTYYANDKSTKFKGTIHRNDMLMVLAKETERNLHYVELSTKTKENRNFVFSSESKEEAAKWLHAITKMIAPLGLLDNQELTNLLFSGVAFMKESLFDEWDQTFLVLCEEKLLYLNRDFGVETLNFNKTFGVKEYRSEEYCFVVGCPGRSLFIQATLVRDTYKMYEVLVKLLSRNASTAQCVVPRA